MVPLIGHRFTRLEECPYELCEGCHSQLAEAEQTEYNKPEAIWCEVKKRALRMKTLSETAMLPLCQGCRVHCNGEAEEELQRLEADQEELLGMLEQGCGLKITRGDVQGLTTDKGVNLIGRVAALVDGTADDHS